MAKKIGDEILQALFIYTQTIYVYVTYVYLMMVVDDGYYRNFLSNNRVGATLNKKKERKKKRTRRS